MRVVLDEYPLEVSEHSVLPLEHQLDLGLHEIVPLLDVLCFPVLGIFGWCNDLVS